MNLEPESSENMVGREWIWLNGNGLNGKNVKLFLCGYEFAQ